MKKIIYSIFFVALWGLQSCSDVLDTSPYDKVAAKNMWTNPELTNQGVAGVYAAMRGWGVYGSASYDLTVVPFECLGMSGEAYRSIPYLSGTAGAGDTFFSKTWEKLYEGVHRANDGIFNLSKPGGGGVDEEMRTRLLAECKFMRAYYYTRLNELYGRYGLGVPIYTEPLKSVSEATKTQSPEAEVWALIVADLTDCLNEPNFPNRYVETGRASKGAAYALRGRAYLMQGAKYANTGLGENATVDKALLQKAADDFSKVQSCGYDLFQNGYKALFTEANEGSVEMIFSLQNIAKTNSDRTKSGYGSRMQLMAGTRSTGDRQNATGFSQYSVSPAIVDLYENKDGTPFNWEDVIPGYMATTEKDRLVYFLRDKEVDGKLFVSSALEKLIDNKIPAATKDKYLPEGNEARLKRVWQNRDPRLYANVILPYGDQYLGTDPDSYKAGVTTPVPYVYRWPVGATNQSVSAQTKIGISAPYDLKQDGTSEAEFGYRHRKFIMEGYDCEYADNNPIDEPIFRYAYVLLMWAEALALQDDIAGAAAKVNLVRGRTSVEMPPYTFASKNDAMDKIRNESRREFVNEGVNFYEEMRWNTLKQTKFSKYMGYDPAAHTCNGMQSNGNGTVKWSTINDYSIFPVPSKEIEKNGTLTKTPGWIY